MGYEQIQDNLLLQLYSHKDWQDTVTSLLAVSCVYRALHMARKDGAEYDYEVKEGLQ